MHAPPLFSPVAEKLAGMIDVHGADEVLAALELLQIDGDYTSAIEALFAYYASYSNRLHIPINAAEIIIRKRAK